MKKKSFINLKIEDHAHIEILSQLNLIQYPVLNYFNIMRILYNNNNTKNLCTGKLPCLRLNTTINRVI